MVMVINKRIKRVLFENKGQYIGAVLLIVLSCFLFTNLVLVSNNLTRLMNEYEKDNVQEDASFTTDKSMDNLPELESASDAIIEEGKSFDYALSEGSTLRVFTKNDKINIPAIIEGNALKGSGEILLNPAFAAAHSYKIGDSLTILDKPFTVAGFMALPNYIYPLKMETDLLYSPQDFGIAVIGKEDFASLGKGSSFYAVKFNHPEENARAQSMKFIELMKSRGIDITQWTDIGVNIRVSGADAKFNSASLMGRAMPTAFFLLTAILLGNVIGRMIKRESVIAGALYALGYKRRELYIHYLKFPLVVAAIGGVLGTVLGLFTVRPMMSVYFTLFDIPMTGINYSPAVIILSLLLPVFFLGLSGFLVIHKELKHSPAELMKGNKEKSKVNFLERRFKLEKLKFALKFKIREQFRSLSRLALLLIGCSVATLLLLFGFFLKSGMDYFLTTEVKNAQNYQYEYVFDSLRTKPVPTNAEPFAVSKFLFPGNDNKVFHVAGYLPDSNISTVVDKSGKKLRIDQVIITKPIADKLNVKPGDTITIVRKSDFQEFSLTVGSIADSLNMTIMMPLAEYNEKFGMPEGSYKEARTFLFGSDDTEPDFEQALRLFLEEAEDGNALAMHDLGRMCADGLGVEMDTDIAFTWYAKALAAFEVIESEKENRYVEYRIGKMYAAGLGTEQDYEEAAGWFSEPVSKKHKYAQYSLAGLYYRGQGVERDYQSAFRLYQKSARQRVPYASYELAKMYRDGIGTVRNTDEAQLNFEEAFLGFKGLEEQSHDDKLQYRLGQMLYTGTGTEKDVDAALGYFEKAARLGNVHAQYMLGKIYLDAHSGHENVEQAILWLTKAADNGNDLAQYALGKLYRDGSHVEKDMEKAISLFTLSAEQDNQYAAYALGKLYLKGEDIPKDVDAALKWLTLSAGLENQFAQYTLAKLYLTGEAVPKDVPKALELFQKSAEQGNQHAQYQLGKLYLLGEDVPKDVDTAIRWLTASAEQGNQYAQYALGKLYLIGHDVPRDRETAVRWLTLSAEQGNIYARFFLDHLDSFRDPSLFLAATRLLHHLSRIFREEQEKLPGGPHMRVESKLRRKIRQKKIAQGHAPDDHEQKLITY